MSLVGGGPMSPRALEMAKQKITERLEQVEQMKVSDVQVGKHSSDLYGGAQWFVWRRTAVCLRAHSDMCGRVAVVCMGEHSGLWFVRERTVIFVWERSVVCLGAHSHCACVLLIMYGSARTCRSRRRG